MYYDNVLDAKKDLEELLLKNKKWYGRVELSLVIAREDGRNILYRGKVDFLHRQEYEREEITHDYGIALLARRLLNIDEFISMLQNWSQEITIKDLEQIDVGEKFINTIHRIPSKYHFRDIIHEWPVKDFATTSSYNTSIKIVNDYLIKPNCPTYPTFTEATRSFLSLDRHYFNNNPFGLQILVPDYRARLNTLELSEKTITLYIETKESKLDQLLLKIFAKTKNEDFVPDDFELKSNKFELELPFLPSELNLFLVSKKDGEVIDIMQYGNYHTENHEGIIIKTSKDVIEEILGKGENSHVEFKEDFSKDEFLETVVSFANSGTGKILLGIDDKGNVLGIHEDFANLVKRIKGTVSGRCEPQIDINIEEVDIRGKPIVVVSVKEGIDKPYLVRTKSAYIRVDDRDIAMSRVELDKIYSQKQERQTSRSGFSNY